jgi:hypothetical protein
MNDAARTYLADLIERQVVRSPGTQKIPAYTESPADQAKIKAAAKVRTLVNGKERMRVAKALEKVCEAEGVPYDILKNFYEGRDVAPDSYPVGLRVWWLPSCTIGTVGQGAEPLASAAPWPCCGKKFAA